MPWRAEDEALLQRLEDELLVERLFRSFVDRPVEVRSSTDAKTAVSAETAWPLHPRAAGLIAELRRLRSGAPLVAAALTKGDDVGDLARFVQTLSLKEAGPELLHHLALFHSRAAAALEHTSPERAATAWVHALAAWLALAEERTYLARLEESVLGDGRRRPRSSDDELGPERAPLELVADIARRAEATARDLGPPGRAALLALARTEEAARIAGASPDVARRLRVQAERRRNAVIEAALSVIGESLDEANVRGELGTAGGALLLRAIEVWSWTSNDEAVEHFVVDRIDRIGWELYRARRWDMLRLLLEPFRPMFDSLAARIERDPSRIAYAAGCAQMFVFLAEVEPNLPNKVELAERAVRVCPTHRNGRLVLASALCDRAIYAMRSMIVFAQKKELERVESMLARAESLYPDSTALAEARGMLERIRTGRIAV